MNVEEMQAKIRAKAENMRICARQISRVKNEVLRFDGKIYNKRFDEAIHELSDNQVYFYVQNSYGWFYIQCTPRQCHNEQQALVSAYSCVAGDKYNRVTNKDELKVFSDSKRIDAAKINKLLTEKYESLMAEAALYDKSADNLETVLDQINNLKKMISAIESPLPYTVREIAGLVRRGW